MNRDVVGKKRGVFNLYGHPSFFVFKKEARIALVAKVFLEELEQSRVKNLPALVPPAKLLVNS
jgi:hypothetical protein